MKHTKQICTILALSSIISASYAKEKTASIIYGDDNRIETFEADPKLQKLASSTAGMLMKIEAIDLGDAYMLPPKSLGDAMGLCKDEKFSDQPSSVSCSGFLVGPDLLVTAGHCVTNQARCEEVSFVFDYKLETKTKKTKMIVPKNKVYGCKKLIDAKLENLPGDKRDYALIKLDRIVKGKRPLKFRSSGLIEDHSSLVVIGHPSGLPQKVAGDAKVFRNNEDQAYFVTNLDTFGGNSGSAVFNEKTGLIEGILVRGAKDYKRDPKNKCIVVNTEAHDITGKAKLGESVSRITDIPSLKYRKAFLNAALKGKKKEMQSHMLKGVNIDIVDNFGNTALHMALAGKKIQLAKYLIETGIDYTARNKKGETALQRLGVLRFKARRIIKRAIAEQKKKKK